MSHIIIISSPSSIHPSIIINNTTTTTTTINTSRIHHSIILPILPPVDKTNPNSRYKTNAMPLNSPQSSPIHLISKSNLLLIIYQISPPTYCIVFHIRRKNNPIPCCCCCWYQQPTPLLSDPSLIMSLLLFHYCMHVCMYVSPSPIINSYPVVFTHE